MKFLFAVAPIISAQKGGDEKNEAADPCQQHTDRDTCSKEKTCAFDPIWGCWTSKEADKEVGKSASNCEGSYTEQNACVEDASCLWWDEGNLCYNKEEKQEGASESNAKDLFGGAEKTIQHNGKTREYIQFMDDTKAPSGLLVAFFIDYAVIPDIIAKTNMMVVAPMPTTHTVPAGQGTNIKCGEPQCVASDKDEVVSCWKIYTRYGSCMRGVSEDSEDVEFIGAVIDEVSKKYDLPGGKVIVSGFSAGGQMAFRFACERPNLTGGLVITGQSFFDPGVGFWDYQKDQLPTGDATCLNVNRPFYSIIGSEDNYYSSEDNMAMDAFARWEVYSKDALGCTGEYKLVEAVAPFKETSKCYEYTGCATGKMNRMCEVTGKTHASGGSDMGPMIVEASTMFFKSTESSDSAAGFLLATPLLILTVFLN